MIYRLPEKSLLFAAGVFISCCFIYLLGFRYVGSGDTRPAELLPLSVIEEGNLNFGEFQKDAQVPYYYLKNNGQTYSAYSPVPGFLNTIIFSTAAYSGLDIRRNIKLLSLFTSALTAAGAAALLFLILEQLQIRRRWTVFGTVLFAFGTSMWSVASRGLWQHGPAVLFVHAGLFALLRGSLPAGGILLGFSVATRTQCALLIGPLVALKAFQLWRHDRMKAVGFISGFFVPIMLLEFYFCFVLGRPFYFLQGGVHGMGGFGGNMFTGLNGLLFNPSRGLFVFSPFLALGTISVVRNWRTYPREVSALLVGALALLLLSARWEVWWGGHSFGYRIITEIASPLIIVLVWHLNSGAGRLFKFLSAAAFVWSLWVHYLGAYFYPCGWNDKPEPISATSQRLWSIRESEISACTDRFFRIWSR